MQYWCYLRASTRARPDGISQHHAQQNYEKKTHLWRSELDVVILGTIVEHRNKSFDRVPHHGEEFAVPTTGHQGCPAKNKTRRTGVKDGPWQQQKTGEPRHQRGRVRSSPKTILSTDSLSREDLLSISGAPARVVFGRMLIRGGREMGEAPTFAAMKSHPRRLS